MNRMRPLIIALIVVALLLPAAIATASTKFTFNDVTLPDGTTGEIEASSKIHPNKGDVFTTCSYYSDDYLTYLGYYTSSEFASEDADAVLAFCLENFEARQLP